MVVVVVVVVVTMMCRCLHPPHHIFYIPSILPYRAYV